MLCYIVLHLKVTSRFIYISVYIYIYIGALYTKLQYVFVSFLFKKDTVLRFYLLLIDYIY